MKTVHRKEELLFPEDIGELYTKSQAIIQEIRNNHPEFENLLFNLTIKKYANGPSKITVVVQDPNAEDPMENVKVGIAIAILTMLLLLVGIYL